MKDGAEQVGRGFKKVEIAASRTYPVWIGRELLSEAGDLVKLTKKPCRAAVITDYTTGGLFENKIERSLRGAGFTVTKMSIPPGEESKNMTQLAEVLAFLAMSGLDRSDLVVALGGGVVGDLAGFAAAIYLRGVDYIQIPTTFLATIDSSVGGKTAVDLESGKNLAGAFHQPVCVICDCDAFRTLSASVFADGAAEAVKYGVLAGGSLFERLAQGKDGRAGLPEELLPGVIEECVTIKAGIVERDEFDKGERQLLNLGHTVGHAVEHLSKFEITHGKAVSIGMAVMARAAERKGIAKKGCADRICAALKTQGLPTETSFSVQELYEASLSDKKKSGETIQIVVPVNIGDCRIRKIPLLEWKEWIRLGTMEGES